MWLLHSPARARRACPLPGQGEGSGRGKEGIRAPAGKALHLDFLRVSQHPAKASEHAIDARAFAACGNARRAYAQLAQANRLRRRRQSGLYWATCLHVKSKPGKSKRDVDQARRKSGRGAKSMSHFDDYKDRFKFIKMERQDGILQMTLHSKGGELLWGGHPHEELSYAFGEVARDHDNRAVIITGTGNSFCADIIWGRTDQGQTATKARPLRSE